MTMPLMPDTLLSTTRAVRRRLDVDRPVSSDLIDQCLELALQAPTGGNRQRWSFVVVTDPALRAGLGDVYRKGFARYRTAGIGSSRVAPPPASARRSRVMASAAYLAENIHRVPVLVVPCIGPRTDTAPVVEQASTFGSILPAVWSFMLAARARNLGTAWTTVHLFHEREAADLLGIPFDRVMQVALIPVAHLTGDGLSSAPDRSLAGVVHRDRCTSPESVPPG